MKLTTERIMVARLLHDVVIKQIVIHNEKRDTEKWEEIDNHVRNFLYKRKKVILTVLNDQFARDSNFFFLYFEIKYETRK